MNHKYNLLSGSSGSETEIDAEIAILFHSSPATLRSLTVILLCGDRNNTIKYFIGRNISGSNGVFLSLGRVRHISVKSKVILGYGLIACKQEW